ncbi:hypothetical protein D4764_20G0009710 [Takifugu flavidus]|uniref:Reverse transcriptase domain-containing protein n=1 Tax=Takifugu flavidus TaxID=433684 RepID=A0A5C6NJZ2_9TELE|nr:hypothetical protein D4764_20G0009710 [Takifugu flavidus]
MRPPFCVPHPQELTAHQPCQTIKASCGSPIDIDNLTSSVLDHITTTIDIITTTKQITTTPLSTDHQPLTLSSNAVYTSLSRIKPLKAAGHDGIPGCVLKACAEQLSGIFTDIFNLSLAHAVVPTCFKATVIVPVPKHSKSTCLNDYHLVALTSIIMKSWHT